MVRHKPQARSPCLCARPLDALSTGPTNPRNINALRPALRAQTLQTREGKTHVPPLPLPVCSVIGRLIACVLAGWIGGRSAGQLIDWMCSYSGGSPRAGFARYQLLYVLVFLIRSGGGFGIVAG